MDNQAASSLLRKIAEKGSCKKRKVGAFVLIDGELSTAANGMPEESGLSCLRGDCPRCNAASFYEHGMGYDLCFCLHAEERLIAHAAREGVRITGGLLYCSYQPCIMCLKKIAEVRFAGVRYIEPWPIPEESANLQGLAKCYDEIAKLLPEGMLILGA